MSYYAEKTAALAAGKPWPPPKENEPPTRTHEWVQTMAVAFGELSVWYCPRCARSVLELQKPPSVGCRRRGPQRRRK